MAVGRQTDRKKTAKSAFLINSVQITWRSPKARECGRGRSKNKNGNLINVKAYIIGNWSQIKSVRQHTASLPAASIAATDMVPSAKLINTLHAHTHTHTLCYTACYICIKIQLNLKNDSVNYEEQINNHNLNISTHTHTQKHNVTK